MSMDSHGRVHLPAGTPNGGRFTGRPSEGDDTDLAVTPLEAKWARVHDIEQAAAAGDRPRALRMAREAGAFTPGEPLPVREAGDEAAYFDGRRFSTIVWHDDTPELDDRFDANLLGDA